MTITAPLLGLYQFSNRLRKFKFQHTYQLMGAIQSDALTLRIFRDMAGFDHGGLLEISLRVRYRDGCRRETEREFQGPPKELPITPRR